jgi:cysteine synthase A
VLSCIGNTSLVPLQRIVPSGHARILVKLETENPSGSMKDRMALAMIEAAEANGRLTRAGVVEYSTGNTGVALALICAVKGLPLHIVTSDAYSPEKRDQMAMFGARFEIVKSAAGQMTGKLTRDIIETARAFSATTGAYWTDQLNNTDQLPAYHLMADEIHRQAGGRIDAFVQAVGSAACFVGVASRLKEHQPGVSAIAVEPAESPVLSGGASGAHRIDGMGAGFVVPLWNPAIPDGIERVSTEEAIAMSLRLAREEGLFGGPTTGANVTAALRLARQLGPGATVVSAVCDTGLKYARTFGEAVARGH